MKKLVSGFNAATGEWVNMIEAGIVDPTKVTRSALQNAASVAAMFLTTEAVVADKPEPAGPAMPDMGGHGWNGRHDVISRLQPLICMGFDVR